MEYLSDDHEDIDVWVLRLVAPILQPASGRFEGHDAMGAASALSGLRARVRKQPSCPHRKSR